MVRLFAATFVILALATPVFAQGVEITNQALVELRTVDANGEETIKYVIADRVIPGSVILYLITYANKGDAPAEGIVLTSQIPADLTFTEGSADIDGARVQFSIDGGKTYANREDLVVTTADGDERPAEASDLTNIRWTVRSALKTGKNRAVSYRAVVN